MPRAPDDTPFHWPRLPGDAYWPGAQPGGVPGGDGRDRTADRQGIGALHPRRAAIRQPWKVRREISRKFPGARRRSTPFVLDVHYSNKLVVYMLVVHAMVFRFPSCFITYVLLLLYCHRFCYGNVFFVEGLGGGGVGGRERRCR